VNFDCACGSSFFLSGHLWIVITAASTWSEDVIIVNLTTKRQNSDTTVILKLGDHSFIKHDTVVSYADARKVAKSSIIDRVRKRYFEPSDDFTDDIIQKIQRGLLISPHTPKYVKKFYKQLVSMNSRPDKAANSTSSN
jgi:hypothetical protein